MPQKKVLLTSRYPADLTSVEFVNAMEKVGFVSVAASQADFSLSLDFDKASLARIRRGGIEASRRALIIREPFQVMPYVSGSTVRKNFAQKIYFGKGLGMDSSSPWPQVMTREVEETSPPAKVCAVASWRVSFLRGSLYDLRSRLFSQLEIDTYGRGWNSSLLEKTREALFQFAAALKYPSQLALKLSQLTQRPLKLLGELESKSSLTGKYKVMLVVENTTGYMSEKLFDAFRLGMIPVYCGGEVERYGVPSSLVIQVDPSIDAVREGIKVALRADYDAWLEQLNSWLSKQSTIEMHRSDFVWFKVLQQVNEYWDQHCDQ